MSVETMGHSKCLCQATVRRTGLPCLRKTKAGSDYCGYHHANQQNKKDSEDCSICMNPLLHSTITTPCHHVFHKSCLNEWTEYGKNSCPNCRGCLGLSLLPPPPPPTSPRRSVVHTTVYDFFRTFNETNGYTLLDANEYILSTHEDDPERLFLYNTLTGILVLVD